MGALCVVFDMLSVFLSSFLDFFEHFVVTEYFFIYACCIAFTAALYTLFLLLFGRRVKL